MRNLFKTPAERDTELLSAYLDDALSPRTRRALEARLQHEPALARQLDEMRRTQMLLRSLPKAKSPRNYTLTPQQAAAIRQLPGRTPMVDLWLRTATAVVAVMLVAVLIGQNFATDVALPATQAPMFEAAPVFEAAPELGSGSAEDRVAAADVAGDAAEEPAGVVMLTEETESEGIAITMATEIAPDAADGAAELVPAPTDDGNPLITEEPSTKLAETPTALPTPTTPDPAPVSPPQPATVPGVPWVTLSLSLLLAGLLGVTVWRWWQNRR